MKKSVKSRARLVCLSGWFLVGVVLWFTPSVTKGSLFDLVLNIDGSQKLNAYNYYTWSRGVSWEVTQSVLATRVYFNKIFTFDTTPNLIGMHLLDIEANNSYQFNLGYVITASFGVDDSLQSNIGSIGGSSSGRGNLTQGSTFGFPPLIPSGKRTDPFVPEPGILSFFALAALYGKWRRRIV
jgi:hypothetical protein